MKAMDSHSRTKPVTHIHEVTGSSQIPQGSLQIPRVPQNTNISAQ